MKELVAYVKANKDKVTYANAGVGIGVAPVRHAVHDRDPDRAHDGALQGHGPGDERHPRRQVDFMCDQTTNTTGQIKSGKVKATRDDAEARAVAAGRADHAGIRPFEFRPRGLAWPVRAEGHAEAGDRQAHAALQAAMKDPNVKSRLAELGTEPVAVERATPDALGKQVKSQVDLWSPIIKKAGVYAD
jgi:tripartite-type tricarboxylate transporter receptor subunit TctC